MRQKKCTPQAQMVEVLDAPAYPKTGSDIVRALEAAVDEIECLPGQHLTQKRFAELVGIPKATLNDWHHGRLVEQIRRFVCALERLNEPRRTTLLRQFCRECPRLHDSRFSHDPGAVSALQELVQQPLGLVFIASASDRARTLLATAMGNSAGANTRACGIDLHQPEDFVPVSGVSYLREGRSSSHLRAVVRELWANVVSRSAGLVVLNGIWSAVPGFRTRIAAMALERNVIVADDFGPDVARLRHWPTVKSTLVTVTFQDRSEQQLEVRIESLHV